MLKNCILDTNIVLGRRELLVFFSIHSKNSYIRDEITPNI